MAFISFEFIVFFFIVLSGSLLIQKHYDRKAFVSFLFVCNCWFYFSWDWRFGFLLLLLIFCTYHCAIRSEKRGWNTVGICITLLMLAVFKYFDFFLEPSAKEKYGLLLPLGISFYSFEIVSYLADIRRKRIKAEEDFLYYAAYISFFPNISCGPIARANELLKQLKNGKRIRYEDIEAGMQIMAIGVFKKMVIADRLGVFVNDVFTFPKAFHWASILLAVVSYSIQIYMDFSGYSDIAIGIARCLGISFSRNFDLPYISKSVTEFWRRWHISLSAWFRDYVYIPLGGNRTGKIKQYVNLLTVMILSGVWHGVGPTYLLWGLFNGMILCGEKMLGLNDKKGNPFRTVLTFLVISLTWVFFKAQDVTSAIALIYGMISLQKGIFQMYSWSFFSIVVIVVCETICIIKNKDSDAVHGFYPLQDLRTVKGLTFFLIFIGLIISLAYTSVSPFVYIGF